MPLSLAPALRVAQNPPWMSALLLTCLELELEPLRAWHLPRDPAVTLRGALGSAMMELACTNPSPSCAGCRQRAGCVIPGWYEPGRAGSAAPRPMALRVDHLGGSEVRPGAPLRVQVWLMGEIPRSSLIVEVLIRMARSGLGPARVPHSVKRLSVQGRGRPVLVLGEDRPLGAWPAPGTLSDVASTPESPAGARVHLQTPTSWTGVDHQRPPSAAALLSAAIGRVRKLAHAQGRTLERRWPDTRAVQGSWRTQRWHPRSRYSERQQHEVDLSGWTGTLELGPEVCEFADLLAAVEVLGVGKGTTAGQGRVLVEWAPRA